MAINIARPFNEGELMMQRLMHVTDKVNPTSFMLTPQAASMFQRAPLIALGILDSEQNPWTTLWGGEAPLAQAMGKNVLGIKTVIDHVHDPIIKTIFLGKDRDAVVQEREGHGRMLGGLAIDLETRKRVKIYGRLMAAAVTQKQIGNKEGLGATASQIQLVMNVEQSLGNCPKYLNKKAIKPEIPQPLLLSDSSRLTPEARSLIDRADLFFMSTSDGSRDMDTNHRGGPLGFVRTLDESDGTTSLFFADYSGNRLYQSLGNLKTTPKAGLVFPDFVTGNVVYLTGGAEILIGDQAAKAMPRSNVVIKICVKRAIHIKEGLPFRGVPGEESPYNPRVRLLANETKTMETTATKANANAATLISQTILTPTISRFTFKLEKKAGWQAGGWVALDFSDELGIGYSHMRDDDPRSLNDDFVRTFTVSSPPSPQGTDSELHFDVTIRKVGVVTEFLFRQHARTHLELPIRGFGGELAIEVDTANKTKTGVVIAGVGVTPLLAQLNGLVPEMDMLEVFWTVRSDDMNLVVDSLKQYPALGKSLHVFVTGLPSGATESDIALAASASNALHKTGATCATRRLVAEDVQLDCLSNKWFVCVGTSMRKNLMEWLPGREIMFEDFNF